MAAVQNGVNQRIPPYIATQQATEGLPASNSCLSRVFASRILDNEADASSWASLNCIREVVWHVLSSCWSAITHFFMNVFCCCSCSSSYDLNPLRTFYTKWKQVEEDTVAMQVEWNQDLNALPQLDRDKLKADLLVRFENTNDPEETARASLERSLNWDVLEVIRDLLAPQHLAQVNAFLATREPGAFVVNQATENVWQQNVQALLEVDDVGNYIIKYYERRYDGPAVAEEVAEKRQRIIDQLLISFQYSYIEDALKAWKNERGL